MYEPRGVPAKLVSLLTSPWNAYRCLPSGRHRAIEDRISALRALPESRVTVLGNSRGSPQGPATVELAAVELLFRITRENRFLGFGRFSCLGRLLVDNSRLTMIEWMSDHCRWRSVNRLL